MRNRGSQIRIFERVSAQYNLTQIRIFERVSAQYNLNLVFDFRFGLSTEQEGTRVPGFSHILF